MDENILVDKLLCRYVAIRTSVAMNNEQLARLRKSGFAPVTFGMAGVIYTEPQGRGAFDESWLTAGFRMTPWTTHCEWHSDDLTVVTYQHTHETKIPPGSFQYRVPNADTTQGVVFGQFFGLHDTDLHPEILSKRILSRYSHCDTSCFLDLNGLWAAVVWDAPKRQAHFARDCIGGQTLYVARFDGRILFATDMRVFYAAGMLLNYDEEAIAQFLHYLYVPAPRVLADGCVAVLPGSVLSIGVSMHQKKYAAPRFVRGPNIGRALDIEREIERQLPAFEDKLLTAVADCVPEDGRIALTLSGGKDSSVLAVALSKICPDRVLALTVGHSDEQLNEAHDAARVCRALGLAHQCYVPSSNDLAQGIVDFARAQDQPVGDPAALPYFLGMSRLPDDCTVVIDGTGNDYYFGIPSHDKGLRKYKRRMEIQAMAGPLWPVLLKAMSLGPLGIRQLSHFWRRPVEESFVAWEGWSSTELAQLFGREISFADTYLWHVMRGADPAEWLELLTNVVCGIWEPHAAYRKAVHFAQVLGKSIRFPFADNRIATFVQGLPEQMKLKGGINKQILRAYMKKNLPREIVEKPKSGFIFDLNQLFMNSTFRWHEELDRAGLLRALPTWSPQPIDQLLRLRQQYPGDLRYQQRLYALCLLATVLAVKDG